MKIVDTRFFGIPDFREIFFLFGLIVVDEGLIGDEEDSLLDEFPEMFGYQANKLSNVRVLLTLFLHSKQI